MVSARLLLCLLLLVCSAIVCAAQDAARTDGWVVIPVDEYRALRARAFPVEAGPPPPPVDAVVTRIAYDLTLGSGSVTGTAALTVDVFKDGWVAVQVPSGLLVSDARLDGRPVSLVDQPSPHVLLSKTGRSQLALHVVAPLTASGTNESLVMPPAGAAATEVTLTMPRTGVELTAANAWVASTTEASGQTRWVAYGANDQPMTFAWRRRVDTRRAEQPLRLRGSVTELVGLGEDMSTVTAAIRVDVAAGVASEVALPIPSGVQVTRVTGGTVGDWQAEGGMLTVRFVDPVPVSTTFTVIGEVRREAAGSIEVPLFRLATADREIGGVAVEVLGAGEITDRRASGLEPGDPLDLGGVVAGRESPSLVAYRYKPVSGRDARTLTVQVRRYASQAVQVANVDEARYQALATEDGKALVRARYAVRNNHRSLLTVSLPKDAVLWSASVAGRVVRPGLSTAGALLVPLERGGRGEELPPFVVEVAYLARVAPWSERGTVRLPMPAIDLPISRTGVLLHYPPRFKLAVSTGSFRVEPFAEPVTAALRGASSPPPPLPAPSPAVPDAGEKKDLDALMQSARVAGNRLLGILPIDVEFPEFGPVLFLASELTPETQLAALDIEFERTRGN